MKTTTHLEGFTVVAETHGGEPVAHVVRMQIFAHHGKAPDGKAIYEIDNEKGLFTEDLPDATPMAEAWVKWDGCCDFWLTGEAPSHHVCGPLDMRDFAAVLMSLHRIAIPLLVTVDGWEEHAK